ncbi:MAG: pseudouridine synthase [Pseudomonadota bacterium]
MTDRRETNRPARKQRSRPKHHRRSNVSRATDNNWGEGERIAKYLARAGISSRREAEALIEAGEVRINGRKLTTPAFKVTGRERIEVGGKLVKSPEPVRVWRYHKPSGLITTTNDPDGRSTIFEQLPKTLPRVVTIGRLDLTTEGLLLLTNDGGLARTMELPKTGFTRRYRARAHGSTTQAALDTLKSGITLEDGTRYTRINAILERETGTNNWIDVELTEGKNREVRKALEYLGLQVNRLIRTQYGPFELNELQPGAVEEIDSQSLQDALGDTIAADEFKALIPRRSHDRGRPTQDRSNRKRRKR